MIIVTDFKYAWQARHALSIGYILVQWLCLDSDTTLTCLAAGFAVPVEAAEKLVGIEKLRPLVGIHLAQPLIGF
jgi:hypothetical protein